MAQIKWYVKYTIYGSERKIKVHSGNKPANCLAGPFPTEEKAKSAKAGLVKKGKIKMKPLKTKRGKGSPNKGKK